MKRKTRWKQIGRAYMMRTGDLVCIGKREENGLLHMTVVEPEYAEATLKEWGEGAFIFDWGIEPKEDGIICYVAECKHMNEGWCRNPGCPSYSRECAYDDEPLRCVGFAPKEG